MQMTRIIHQPTNRVSLGEYLVIRTINSKVSETAKG